eukprot:56037-Eustigmatos_ZCMA.PRE.1
MATCPMGRGVTPGPTKDASFRDRYPVGGGGGVRTLVAAPGVLTLRTVEWGRERGQEMEQRSCVLLGAATSRVSAHVS